MVILAKGFGAISVSGEASYYHHDGYYPSLDDAVAQVELQRQFARSHGHEYPEVRNHLFTLYVVMDMSGQIVRVMPGSKEYGFFKPKPSRWFRWFRKSA